MRHILSLILTFATAFSLWAQGGSGQGFDPSNPPDPQMGYHLKVKAAPAEGGTVSPKSAYPQEGETVYCEAYPRLGYSFRAWMVGDSVVSNDRYFYFQMPGEATELTAWFDKTGFNPENPGDPYLDGYTHKVNVYCSPSMAGWTNNDNFLMKEGDETWLYAYENPSFKFSCWKQDGKIISTDRELPITMGDKNLEYTAQYVFNPTNPGEPWPNSWDAATGELIIDHFEPDYLWDAIYQMTGEDYGNVANLKVIGKMSAYDLGVVRNLTGLTEADFSRTSGYEYVPSWIFENCEALTKVLLPSSINEIHDCAFYGCQNLSELVIYASMPPMVYSDAFYGVPENLVVKVYSGSLDLYMQTEPWSNYKIMTIDEDSTALSVTLPDDAADGRYRNASLQLNNLTTGQSQKLVITGSRVKFIFGNLIPDTKYSLYVLAPNGHVIGSLLDFSMDKEGYDHKFTSLLQPQELRLALTAPDGMDKAEEAMISWFDEKHDFIGSGNILPGQVEGYQVNYEITLPRELAIEYVIPEGGIWTVQPADNLIELPLVALDRHVVSGKITDAQLEEPLAGGYVTVTQTVNGQHIVSATATTAADGSYSLTVYDVPGVITAGSPDHIEISTDFSSKAELDAITNIAVKPLVGSEVLITLLSRDNIEKDATDNAFSPYQDFANVEFTATNLTNGRDIDFRMRYPRMLLLDQVNEGDRIRISATPRNSGFNGSADETIISGDKGEVKITFTSNGDLKASYADSNAEETVGLLYDQDGRLYKKGSYTDNAIAFLNLPDGEYTLVTMMSSKLFSAAGSISELNASSLSAGKDYLVNEVGVESGYITHVDIDVVPAFDESLFYYTGDETSISVNKTSVTVGQIVTVRSKVDFLPEFAGSIDKVNVIFSIPEGCDYVDNSLLVAGNGANFTTTSDGRLSVEMEIKDASPRFCIIPRKGGEYRPSAVIEFEYNGELISQPIGSALFTAGDFTISVPEKTSVTRIAARGTATALSEVKVYDNDVFIGSTRSLTNGDWRLKFDLYNPGDFSEHFIYAEITTPEGVKYKTTTGKTIYDKEWPE
ncbi:MAG: leucine-rich repeat protein, partial [Muribaculaceae bacterium]|nr:leucine-rich repeat protein [Muribaculaceae bacterium]